MSIDDKNKITIAHKKNVLDNEPKKLALLEEMKSITGSEWQFVLSPQMDAFVPRVLKVNNDRIKTVGDYLFGTEGYLYWIVEKFREACKDDLIREALLEATKGRKIVFTLRDEDTREKGIKFTDNFFHVYTTPKHFGYSVKYIAAEDLSTLL